MLTNTQARRISPRGVQSVLLGSTAYLVVALSAAAAAPGTHKVEATILVAGEPSGSYREETIVHAGHVEDTAAQLFIFNRQGSRIEVSQKDVYEEDAVGRILGGHSETSSSKSTMTTDYIVRGNTIAVTTQSGGHSYTSEVPVDAPLFGPAGMRKLMARGSAAAPDASYATFVPALGGVKLVGLKYIGTDKPVVDGVAVPTREFEQTIKDMPGKSTLWVDDSNYTVQMTMDSPFGLMRIVRGKPGPDSHAKLPAESYESTLAISNIKLPHPRMMDAATIEVTKKPGATGGWPDFVSENQRVITQSPVRTVLEITRPRLDGHSSKAPLPADSQPNALIQSDDPAVIALARTIAGSESDPWKEALLLQSWTAANMHFDAGIAVAPAAELVRDRHGTCMGYSILLASLARARGIPAHIRMGYVYDGGIWGGHAWVEMYIRGQWLPIDASEYRSGVADAARFGVITVAGEGGNIEHVGDLALLFGKIDVRTLGYTLGGKAVVVGRDDADHVVEGDTYSNSWLGLTLRKPAGFAFSDLDAHWPNRNLLSLTSPTGDTHIVDLRAGDAPLDKQMMEDLKIAGASRAVTWNGAPAVRIDGPDKSALASVAGDVIWTIVADGPDASSHLDKVAAATSIAELAGR